MSALPFLKEGKLLALGVNTPHSLLRDVATISDMLPSFEDAGSYVLLAPADTPQPILNLIANDVTRILIVGRKTEHAGGGSGVRSQADGGEYDEILRSQLESLAKFVRAAGIKVE